MHPRDRNSVSCELVREKVGTLCGLFWAVLRGYHQDRRTACTSHGWQCDETVVALGCARACIGHATLVMLVPVLICEAGESECDEQFEHVHEFWRRQAGLC